MAGPGDVWAVGATGDSTGGATSGWDASLGALQDAHILVIHWDGRQWTTVGVTGLGSGRGFLQSVAAIARDDVWAVGAISSSATSRRALILHGTTPQPLILRYAAAPCPATPESTRLESAP